MTDAPLSPNTVVAFIADIFLRRGADSYLGEEVTMSEHMLQGALLAQQAGANDKLIAAVLLHDIGHYTNEFPEDALDRGIDNHHDSAGAAVLEPYFPQTVVDCVRHHVAAKRYLCATDPDYFDRLSAASVHTLNLQGGPMTTDEVASFIKNSALEEIVQVRIWDDEGKVAGVATPQFDHFMPLLQRLVDQHCGV
ncbi:MAG: HD domain-containing protein [Alphaproteobacteria bacterium]|jgi:[1-hydroxy-2-(trimethylamino)ethyl]phosphonate dioxygenase|nr:HD domain-containing protein [Alphaproteobacteria bacterium]MBT4084730.1 HD domain-containing protein [Alphaproteobacteria bacterium]MBT4544686.1 HD domain-containing protein [Alphaproteobacteria bacterium]MBT7744900.1 HD domain-containing protein [Alphaproteobacteria bacterium]